MKRLNVVLCGLMLAAFPSTSALADTVYTYTGNTFDRGIAVGTPLPDGPFTANDFVSGSFTVSTPLAPNMVVPGTLQSIVTIPTAFNFSDGYETFSNTTAVNSFFEFGTDGAGNITSWWVQILGNAGFSEIDTNDFHGYVFDLGSAAPLDLTQGGVLSNDPGTWTSDAPPITPSTVTPEPSSLFLLGTGALGLVGSVRRKLLG